MKKQKVMSQMKGQDKTPEKQINEVEIGKAPEKELRIMIVNMIQDLRKRMEAKLEEMQKTFTKDLERNKVKSLSRVRLFETPRTAAHQAPPSMGFSRQEYWSGLPFPSPGDLPDPGIKPGSPTL